MLADERKKAIGRWTACWLGLMLMAPTIVQAERLPIKTYTTADGLVHDRVKHIARDSHGFLWFCTVGGLSRFDGYRFTNYSTEHGLPSSVIRYLLETRNGVYWVATNGGGVCRFNPNAGQPSAATGGDNGQPAPDSARGGGKSLFTVYPLGDEPFTNVVNVLYEDRDGWLWAGTGGGLFRLEETNGQETFRRVELGLPSQPDRSVQVWALVEDREGSLWIGTSLGLVRRLPDGRMIHYPVQPLQGRDLVNALLEDREGRLWMIHTVGLIVFNPESASASATSDRLPWPALARSRIDADSPDGRVDLPVAPGEARLYTGVEGLEHTEESALYQTSDGRIWIGTDGGGLIEFDGQTFRNYTTAQGLSDNKPIAMAEDLDGNLWIGTFSSGVIKIARNGFISYGQADGLGHTRIVSIFEDQAGELCVSSGDWFINCFDGKRFTPIQPHLPKQIIDLGWEFYQISFQDHTGEWWVPTGRGLYRFPEVRRIEQLAHTRPKAIYTTRDGLTGDLVNLLFEDAQGDIWIATVSNTRNRLTRWERATHTFHRYTQADGLPPYDTPTESCADAAGNLWIGFHGGLARYRDGRFRFLTAADGAPEGGIRGLYLDHAGRLWVGSSAGGLGRLDDPAADPPRFMTYSTVEGLAGNTIRCITEDAWGRIYIGAGRGIDRLDPATGRIKHYTIADGLANSYVNAAFRDRQGGLWFGTLNGLSRLVPEPDRPQPPPPIWIGGLRITGAPQRLSELGETEVAGLVLEPNRNQLQIDFFGLSFAAGEALRYQYKLEGADQDWGAPTDQRSVNYASLSPGEYHFLVRAVSTDGLVSPTPATVAFTILPPIWQRWWFLLLAVLIVGLAGYAVHRYRVARLLELERVRTRIATDLHDDIGSSLSQMAILSEVVKQHQSISQPELLHMLTQIADLARGLVDGMSDIVWSIDPRRDDLSNLALRIGQFAFEVLEAKGIAWELQTRPPSLTAKLAADQRRQIYLIFKEAITNIARHSACTSVVITIRVTDHRLMAEIQDDGRGFDVAVPSQDVRPVRGGQGLKNMHARAAELGGQVRIDSAAGRGTRLTLSVPLK